jgi:microcystin-dependent protein
MAYYTGELIQVAFDQSPHPNFLFCDGSTVNISSYPELFDAIGTTFGGDGVTNFNLPDFRPISPKTGNRINVSNGNIFRGQQYFKFYICALEGTEPDLN